MKTCTKCKKQFPETVDYFYTKGHRFDSCCKNCKNVSSSRNNIAEAISNNMTNTMFNKSITVKEVCESTGLSSATISKIKNGSKKTTIEQIELIAKALTMTIYGLLNTTIHKNSRGRNCSICKNCYPLNEKYFYRDNAGHFKRKCIECYLVEKKRTFTLDYVKPNRNGNRIIRKEYSLESGEIPKQLIESARKIKIITRHVKHNNSN